MLPQSPILIAQEWSDHHIPKPLDATLKFPEALDDYTLRPLTHKILDAAPSNLYPEPQGPKAPSVKPTGPPIHGKGSGGVPIFANQLLLLNCSVCIVLYCIVLYCIVLYCIVLYCVVLCCVVLSCIVLYCIVLYCIVLYCVLYCIVLYCIVWSGLVWYGMVWYGGVLYCMVCNVCMHVRMYVCMYVCMYGWMDGWDGWMCVCMCMYVHGYIIYK